MQTVILNLPLGKLTGSAVFWRSSSDCRSPEHTFCLDMFSISSGQHTSPNWWNLIGKKNVCTVIRLYILVSCCHRYRYLRRYWTDLYLYMVFFSIVIPVHGTLFTFDVAASLIDRVDEMAPKQKYLWTVVDRYGSDAMISLLNLVHSLSIYKENIYVLWINHNKD